MTASDGRTFTDIEDFVDAVRDARIMLVVTSPGVFWARLAQLTLPHLHLLAVSESLPRAAYIALSPEQVCVGFPLQVDSSSVWCGVRLQRGHIVFHSRAEHFHQRTNGPAEWGLISMDPQRLAATGLALTGQELVAPPSGRILDRLAAILRVCFDYMRPPCVSSTNTRSSFWTPMSSEVCSMIC
ncbi:hypothetical protein [Bradyrhizobium sp. 6(2017)]|uniref:hypothetical protein n=1 Tax=Bradyrhizobium sp. 6(2017) TaxID=1197460 RepID=UPI0013E1E3B1|nr:hypothetical protein [Bradyrhizobium sp. 6(2017)]QIG98301.1 hypothetical protein G6P99_43045 [Bradyrhizobium sp. 6(2017)]